LTAWSISSGVTSTVVFNATVPVAAAMTCYQRHLRPLFESLGLEYDKANRGRVDMAIRGVLGLAESAQCPEVWSAIEALSPTEREDLAARVDDAL
jgi:hypothetical protein